TDHLNIDSVQLMGALSPFSCVRTINKKRAQ
ncbi:hypothetical protein Pgy4_41269, partial [Pseudomonas savastanoi pv. glycinea str. race 4]